MGGWGVWEGQPEGGGGGRRGDLGVAGGGGGTCHAPEAKCWLITSSLTPPLALPLTIPLP